MLLPYLGWVSASCRPHAPVVSAPSWAHPEVCFTDLLSISRSHHVDSQDKASCAGPLRKHLLYFIYAVPVKRWHPQGYLTTFLANQTKLSSTVPSYWVWTFAWSLGIQSAGQLCSECRHTTLIPGAYECPTWPCKEVCGCNQYEDLEIENHLGCEDVLRTITKVPWLWNHEGQKVREMWLQLGVVVACL